MPRVSVIIPIYNVEKYVEDCLNSVINQTLKDIEIICVDDCGQDNSMQIVEDFAKKDKRIKIVAHKENQGLGEARNTGIKNATGEYIAFLDSDDFVDLNYYETLYNTAIKNDFDIVSSNVIYYYSKDKKNEEYISYWQKKKYENIIEFKNNLIRSCSCWNRIYKKSLIDKYNIVFPKGLFIEDIPFTFISMIVAEKISLVNDVNLYYRQRNDSIMKNLQKNRKSFDIFKIYDFCDLKLKELDITEENKIIFNKILDNFKIMNIYAWYFTTNIDYKKDYFEKMQEYFKTIDINNNQFITNNSRSIYDKVNKYDYDEFITLVFNENITYIKLFGLIPLLKIEGNFNKKCIKLFNVIPLLKIEQNKKNKDYKLFNFILLLRTRNKQLNIYQLIINK